MTLSLGKATSSFRSVKQSRERKSITHTFVTEAREQPDKPKVTFYIADEEVHETPANDQTSVDSDFELSTPIVLDDAELKEKLREMRSACDIRLGSDSLADRNWTVVFGWVRTKQDSASRIQAAFRGEMARRKIGESILLERERRKAMSDTMNEDTDDEVEEDAEEVQSLASTQLASEKDLEEYGMLSPHDASDSELPNFTLGDNDADMKYNAYEAQKRFLHFHEKQAHVQDEVYLAGEVCF